MVRKGGSLRSLADCEVIKTKTVSTKLHRIVVSTLLWQTLYFPTKLGYNQADMTSIFPLNFPTFNILKAIKILSLC